MNHETSLLPLHELVEHSRRNVRPEALDKDGDYILLEHIVAGTGQVTPSNVAKHVIASNKTAFDAGDVLYGKLRPNLRKVCVAVGSGYCSTDILALKPTYESSNYYLAGALRSETFTAQVMRLVSGANLPRIALRDLLKLEVPWPSKFEDLERLNLAAKQTVALRNDISSLSHAVASMESSLWQ